VISQESRQRGRRRSREEAEELVAEYKGSGLSQAAFCSEKELSLKSLSRYLTRNRKQRVSGKEAHRFIEVEVATHKDVNTVLTVVLPRGRRIEVKSGFDAGTLRQLIAVLEEN
jgi:hypothetical protein